MIVTRKTVLRAIRQFGPDCRANDVYDALKREFGGEPIFGLIFTVLDDLTRNGAVTYRAGEPDASRTNRRPRLYTITPQGVEEAAASPDLPAVSTDGGFALG